MPKPKNPKPPYPAAFRQQMVELVAAGRRPSELAKEFGCHETSILSWVRMARAATPSLANLPPTLHESERAELLALCKENRQIKMERDILAKACELGLQTKAIRRTRHLHADRRKSGQTTSGNDV
jgi:transposase